MQNLSLQDVCTVDIDLGPSAVEDEPITHCCLDSTEGLLYAVTRDGLVLCLAEGGKKLLWSVQLPLPEPVTTTGQPETVSVVAFGFVLELDAVFIACSSGELLVLHTDSHEVEEVGVVAGGLAAAAWSPDGELLVLLGFDQLLLLMNKDWDVLAEVSVPAPEQTPPAAPQQQLLSATLAWRGDSKYFASNSLWASQSSSGSNAAVVHTRLLHIWDREDCQLHATAEAAAGLAAPIAWQPNSRHLYAAAAVASRNGPREAAAAAATAGFSSKGQPLKAAPHQGGGTATTVAGTKGLKQQQQQQQGSSVDVAGDSWLQHVLLYERNGLQHGGFDVPTYSPASSDHSSSSSSSKKGVVIQALHWSVDSELLAVVLAPAGVGQQLGADAPSDDSGSSSTHEWHVQVWHRSNWHWYLKHEQLHSLPDSAGSLLATWDDIRPLRLHLLAGSGAYMVLDFHWSVTVSARGTAAVVDGHQLLITPLRHCQVPPPMCAVRAVLPCPINALAWFDGDVKADLDATPQAIQQQQQGPVDVIDQGFCEVLAVLLSDGQVLFLRSVESDLWEETLEDQVALGGPKEYLLPLRYCPASACQSNSSSGGGVIGAKSASNGNRDLSYLSMTSGPWTPLDENSNSNTYKAAAAEQVHQLEQQYLPIKSAAAAAEQPHIPLAEGRTVVGLVWLCKDMLLLLAAPYPAEEGLESGEGTVLVEVSVRIPAAAAGLLAANDCQVSPEPESQTLRVSYAGDRVVTAAAHPAGGALVQLTDGQLLYYSCSGELAPLSSTANFPVACRKMVVLPDAPAPVSGTTTGVSSTSVAINHASSSKAVQVAAMAPAVGLSDSGNLYWGQTLIASGVVSIAVRGGGPGGPALVFTTRQALLFVVMVGQLPNYQHVLPDESSGHVTYKRSEYPGDLRAAMSVAMRPAGAAAGARDPHIRAVEPGAMVLASPWGDVGVILQMQRGNLEGFHPRLLTLAAICEALESQSYSKAWDLTVTNRVDLNLIVDHVWPRFLGHADQFVAAVQDPSDLCDLFFALQQSSVLEPEGIYASLSSTLGWQQQHQAGPAAAANAANGLHALETGLGQLSLAGNGTAAAGTAAAGGLTPSSSSSSSNKVSAVCEAVRSAVLKLPGRYLKGHLKTVVMSYAKSDPPSLASALIAIREVKEASTGNTTATTAPFTPSSTVAAAVAVTAEEAAAAEQLSDAADAALKHLLLYVDVDVLYRTALGLYDLSLAFMVVSHSQKDPGEYLAELTSFGSQSNEHLRCHAIDMSLGRYDKALEHLVAAGPEHFEAALKLARDKGLLRQLLALTQQQQQQTGQLSGSQQLVAVLSAYGDALSDARKAEDAAVAYSAAGLTDKALGAYKTAGAWRMCMVLAARLQYPQHQQQLLARELSEQLQASGAGADAAQLLVQYLQDIDGGVSALVVSKEWREALRVAYAADRKDLVDTIVVPSAAQSASVLLSEATESIERLQKYTARLQEVRQRRLAMEAALAAADAEAAAGAPVPDDDLVSESPSMISGFSMYTDRTAAGTGIGGSSIASSSRAASTTGGRRPLRNQKKAAKKGKAGKIRAGSPGEETALAAHLETLVPAKHVLEEAGQLAELLVMLQHVEDASKLQQRVGQWQAAAAAAMEEVKKGQQQQQQGVAEAAGQHPGQQVTGGATVAGAAAVVSKLADEVRWKWDVLREHK